jgi:putative membrane protein insertion efficiency factor
VIITGDDDLLRFFNTFHVVWVPVGLAGNNKQSRFWKAVLNLPGRGVIGLVRLYQMTLSPLLGPTCRFHPSCSHYMIEAVQKYGVIAGGWKGIKRIARCHPFHPGGYDPP